MVLSHLSVRRMPSLEPYTAAGVRYPSHVDAVSGQSKPASRGEIKSSHFEKLKVRRTGSSTHPWLTETCHGESAQDGEDALDSTAAFDAMVPAADRPRAGDRSRDGAGNTWRTGWSRQNQPFRPPGLRRQNQPLSPGCRVPHPVAPLLTPAPVMTGLPNPPFRPPGRSSAAGLQYPPFRPPGGHPKLLPEAPAGPATASRSARSILAKLDQGLSAQRIYQDLVADHGFTGSYYSVKRFVRRLEQTHALPFRGIECAAGDEAQVDFGIGRAGDRPRRQAAQDSCLARRAAPLPQGVQRRRRSARRPTTSCAAWRTRSGTSAAVPRRSVIDNLQAAVKQADWFDPELVPKFAAFATHYGMVILPTRPYTPRHKGKVERGVEVRPGQRPEGPEVRQPGRAESRSCATGS